MWMMSLKVTLFSLFFTSSGALLFILISIYQIHPFNVCLVKECWLFAVVWSRKMPKLIFSCLTVGTLIIPISANKTDVTKLMAKICVHNNIFSIKCVGERNPSARTMKQIGYDLKGQFIWKRTWGWKIFLHPSPLTDFRFSFDPAYLLSCGRFSVRWGIITDFLVARSVV